MRSLNRRQAVGAMALTVVEHLMEQERFRETISLAQLLVENDPTDGFSWAHQGQASFAILKSEFPEKYCAQWAMPLQSRAQYWSLLQRNQSAFESAKRLGWEPIGARRS